MEAQREMTLDEYVGRLTSHHAAARELYALRAERDALKAELEDVRISAGHQVEARKRAEVEAERLRGEYRTLEAEVIPLREIRAALNWDERAQQFTLSDQAVMITLSRQARAALRGEQPTGGGEARDA